MISIRSRSLRAFTLIELLIVVAIIAILAAIAVPNFLEAQVRSKVSRVKADQRTYATAIEAYAVDWNEYPPVILGSLPNFSFVPLEEAMLPLSTPVSYLSDALIVEPFNSKQGSIMYRGWDVLGPGTDPAPDRATRQAIHAYISIPPGLDRQLVLFLPAYLASQGITVTGAQISEFVSNRWFVMSPGPDTFFEYDKCVRAGGGDELCIFNQIASATIPAFNAIYDPTNGTVSNGEVARTAQGAR